MTVEMESMRSVWMLRDMHKKHVKKGLADYFNDFILRKKIPIRNYCLKSRHNNMVHGHHNAFQLKL
jgi:hypothetical protein